jgi:hypothetical protein
VESRDTEELARAVAVLRLRSRLEGDVTSVERFRLSRLVDHSTNSGLSRSISTRNHMPSASITQ